MMAGTLVMKSCDMGRVLIDLQESWKLLQLRIQRMKGVNGYYFTFRLDLGLLCIHQGIKFGEKEEGQMILNPIGKVQYRHLRGAKGVKKWRRCSQLMCMNARTSSKNQFPKFFFPQIGLNRLCISNFEEWEPVECISSILKVFPSQNRGETLCGK